MRLFSILTSSAFLLVIHEVLSAWFLAEFFLARDSSIANNVRKQEQDINGSQMSTWARHRININTMARGLLDKHCPPINTNSSRAAFEKIVFIIIDALGSKFIPELVENVRHSNKIAMPFVEQLLREHKALGFTAKAATPTVTMPRIKALVSGTIPSFVDILHNLVNGNFNATNLDDNILRIAKSEGKSIVFYGDDTWFSLFEKDIFVRSRETLSLFATDYTSVDTNVSEMALPETKRDPIDWDYMILHYLGLDHVGHSFGSNSHRVIDMKLVEMDNVIKEIYDNLSSKSHRTLIVICGDHGMNQDGNHGGDSDLESNTAMLFLPLNIEFNTQKKKLKEEDSKILQIDLATTLSILTGMRTPSMSRGVPIKPLLEWVYSKSDDRLLCASLETVAHLAKIVDETTSPSSVLEPLGSRIIQQFDEHYAAIQNGHNIDRSMSDKYFELAKSIQKQLIITIASKSSHMLISACLIFAIILTLVNLRRSGVKLYLPLMLPKERALCLLVALLPIVMQISTDYIELEHYYWPIYSLTVFVAFLMAATTTRHHSQIMKEIDTPRIALFLVAFFIHYSWNNLDYRSSQNWLITVVSMIIMSNFTKHNSDLHKVCPSIATTVSYFVGLCVLYTKSQEEQRNISGSDESSMLPLATVQILSFMLIVSLTIVNIWSVYAFGERDINNLVQKLATSWMWFALLLSRPRNLLFMVSNLILEASVNSIANTFHLSPIARCLIYMQFSTSSFYNQGNTNLFSSIDVKPAFFGQSQYNFVFAAPLVACATYSSQIYWYLKLFQRVQCSKDQEHMDVALGTAKQPEKRVSTSELRSGVRDFIDMQNYLTLAFYMFVCLVLRNHLFVWSVLSPKLVYHWMGTMVVLRLTTLSISSLPSLVMWFMSGPSSSGKYAKLSAHLETSNV